MERLTQRENDKLIMVKQDNGEYIPAYWNEDNFKAIKKLADYEDIGTTKELKDLKENGAFTGVELAKLAIMQKELKKYKDLEEQGLLVRLPFKLGTVLFRINKGARKPIIKMKVFQITVASKSYSVKAIEEDYGEVFFFRRCYRIKSISHP